MLKIIHECQHVLLLKDHVIAWLVRLVENSKVRNHLIHHVTLLTELRNHCSSFFTSNHHPKTHTITSTTTIDINQ